MGFLDRVRLWRQRAAPPAPAPAPAPASAAPPAPRAPPPLPRKALPVREPDYLERFLCPGCAREYLLPRAPPAGAVCPACRRAGRAPRYRPCHLCGAPFAPEEGHAAGAPCRACEAHFRGGA